MQLSVTGLRRRGQAPLKLDKIALQATPCSLRLRAAAEAAGGLTGGITRVILDAMKTAISVPDPIFRAGERHASRFRLSRSELYASALKEYLARHGDDAVTESLNRVYSREPSELDPALKAHQLRALATESWK